MEFDGVNITVEEEMWLEEDREEKKKEQTDEEREEKAWDKLREGVLCKVCGVTFKNWFVFKRHWFSIHISAFYYYQCPVDKKCPGIKRLFCLGKHLKIKHGWGDSKIKEAIKNKEIGKISKENVRFIDPGNLVGPEGTFDVLDKGREKLVISVENVKDSEVSVDENCDWEKVLREKDDRIKELERQLVFEREKRMSVEKTLKEIEKLAEMVKGC